MLQKLEGFFPPLPLRLQQNGGFLHIQHAGSSTEAPMDSQYSIREAGQLSSGKFYAPPHHPLAAQPSPDPLEADDSLAFQNNMEVGTPQTATHPPVDHPDPIASFPTSGQPVSDSVMKNMLLSLPASLQADML